MTVPLVGVFLPVIVVIASFQPVHGRGDNGDLYKHDDIFLQPSWNNFQVSSNNEMERQPGFHNGVVSNEDILTTNTNVPVPDPMFRYVKKKGRITLDLNNADPFDLSANATSIFDNDNQLLSISVDPFATIRLVRFGVIASKSLIMAFLGTLRLLGPLVFSRRVLAQGGELVSDYMMGRYMRTTFDHWERKYWKEYQGPAATRSVCRCFIHGSILLLLGIFMEWMVGLGFPPCLITQGACHWWCGLLWVVSVIGAGNFFAALISTRGPLKIKVTKSSMRDPNTNNRRRFPGRVILLRTRHVLKWMKDPDQWLTSIATHRRDNSNSREPFTPEPLLFPSTWPPFSILRNFAIAKAMASTQNLEVGNMHIIMRQFLIQHALLDEWHRVLMDERRVGLGVCSIAAGFIATCFLFVTVALADNVSAVLLIPSLLATFGSGWMNLFVFWERKKSREREFEVQIPNPGGRRRRYSIKW